MKKNRSIALTTILVCLASGSVYASEAVVYWLQGSTIYRGEDLNLDGDILDAGETGVFTDAPSSVEGMDVNRKNGDVYYAEESAEEIYRLRDLNGDGDAMDPGESVFWADDGSSSCDSIEAIAIDESTTTIYSTYEDEDCIDWHRDLNGDGDALDAGERGELTTTGSDLESITVDSRTGTIYAGNNNDDVRVVSSTGELLSTITTLGHEANAFDEGRGVLYSGEEDFTDAWRWTETDGKSTYGTIPNGEYSETIAVDSLAGDLYVGTTSGNIYRFADLNNDGDASDPGEIWLFMDDTYSWSEVETMGVFHPVSTNVPAVTPFGLTLLAAVMLLFGFVALRVQRHE